jgi:hypothetical protein
VLSVCVINLSVVCQNWRKKEELPSEDWDFLGLDWVQMFFDGLFDLYSRRELNTIEVDLDLSSDAAEPREQEKPDKLFCF